MKKIYLAVGLALIAIAGTTSAEARDSFRFSINLGAPIYYVGPPVIYAPPPVYYSQPPVVYYDPAPAAILDTMMNRASVTIMAIVAADIGMDITTTTTIDRKQI